VFTPFHKPPYTYPYGRSVDETMTGAPAPVLVAGTWQLILHLVVSRGGWRTLSSMQQRA
jgi:hypothetical protein